MNMRGSIRKRGAGSWELRVFVGTDPHDVRQSRIVRVDPLDFRHDQPRLERLAMHGGAHQQRVKDEGDRRRGQLLNG
jgi:hypothetical protein